MTESTTNPLRDAIKEAIDQHEVILFMKGTPEQPRCGFSARTAGVLNDLGVEFGAVDVLEDPQIRVELSALSNWPTIPQLFVRKELVGGCDIVCEMYETGELATLIGVKTSEGNGSDGPSSAMDPEQPPIQIENKLDS
jgi:monothiol glutaredoxin